MVRHHDGYRSLLLISRDPKTAPTVDIWDVTRKPILDQNGHFDHAVLQINPMHHVTTRDDRKAIVIYTEAGRAFHRPIWSEVDSIDFRFRSETIREWLTECETYHPGCRKVLKVDVELAARMIQVREQEPNLYSTRLVPSEGIDLHNKPYLVLSHVWGGIDLPCKTTSENIAQYYDIGIDFDNLPKTFQDAVRITTAIGFQYLWIDSLCIIQDDERDWQRESAKMAAIYRAATITLSATSANNSHEGCGLSPKRQSVKRFSGPGSGSLDFAARETVVLGRSSTDILKEQLRDGPVHSRAWILQEKLLSRRILHAVHSQFVWQCNVITESEDGMIHQQKSDSLLGIAQRNSDVFTSKEKSEVSESSAYEFDRHWWGCVADYSERTLSVASDQYAALAGIVKHYQEMTGDQPIVGLWERHLIVHLAWEVLRDPREQTVPLVEPNSRRPSWTWMSFCHGSVKVWATVQWKYLLKNESTPWDLGIVYQAQVLNANVKWSGQPLTSDPSGSTIRIRGIMRRMLRPKPVRSAVRSPLRLDPGIPDDGGGSREYDTFALFAYVLSPVLINQPPFITTTYLILQATEPEDRGQYMRIGKMVLTEEFHMGGEPEYVPEGVQRDITLV
ncbi:uncharacterized protein SETTUDRAFT_86814 [Exserohilum turcica Et28A]|uniref:Heterokaryon incompatibility domain-containing protein n=1 Tax=Exserohilum turcicum (strain 28A) TaxID=671987 RepID=R0KR45_EXST2|nr:uncharacterized protein SETTUDRAFT_86814 [Exserohilum turcica Et28A]EOA91479.1 hypothetical protein SETTUDRAFT_86814 [Exserohilum turcica Et28A]